MHLKRYYVYLLTNRSHTIYVGVTSDLETRVLQHKRKALPGFTATYNIDRLVHYEMFRDAMSAIEREKRSRGGRGPRRSR
ncbi:MAG: excinuclease subunit [Phycisphaerales bacterium]|nr:excinuclease subunit [Phycisphaerales bacterium]